jgi:NAD(P)-dependent dehydrogenase (short-subunit alcohol dehydrogenase family)
MQIKDSVALVTGSGVRVGKQIASTLAQKGARLAIHYNKSRGPALAFARELKAKYRAEAETFHADLGKVSEVWRLAAAVTKRMGRVDILVNSASIYERIPFERADESHFDRHIAVNLKAPFFLTQAVGTEMKRAGRGKIVNICDWAALRPYAGYAAYCASKAGLLNLTYSTAKALAPEVQVNAVLPGPVALPPDVGAAEKEAIRKATLVQKLGTPKDVANAVAFLIEGSDFITGAALTVDGGRLIA